MPRRAARMMWLLRLTLGLAALAAAAVPAWLAVDGRSIPASRPAPAGKTIALTFDDVPRGPGAFYTPEQRTRLLIDGLRAAHVEQAAFFVNPGRITPATGNAARVDAYTAAGHVIADHSFSHHDLRAVSAEAFLADIDKAEGWLKGRPGYRPWFRFPGLNQGGRDIAKWRTVMAGLKARGLLIGAVTADASDWNIERLTIAAKKAGQPMDLDALEKLYVESMVQSADFSDAIMVKTLARSPAHVLLLHETDLAARYIVPLAAALRADGWTIVTADAAFADPIYHAPLSGPSNGTLTEALAWARHVPGPLSYDRTEPAVGNRLFAARVMHPPAPVAPPTGVAAARDGRPLG